MKKKQKMVFILVALIAVCLMFPACASVQSAMENLQGSLVGDNFKILTYDDYGNNTLTAQGRNINIGLFKNYANETGEGYASEVLEITVEGKQLLHVGSTIIFAEKGINMIKDFDLQYLKNATTQGKATFVALDRSVNNYTNLIGKKKTIIVKSQMGILIGVYQGDRVLVEIPTDLPKMTRLIIDGKSLYIHRADYEIFDTGMFK
ncbi:DUF5052 family protein [Dehalobacter sp. DCM]|uniref:DUF5052 family protein n=1 Tax=Dehalobacter sp. DCM TaxID=2907827 RepID=UPI0030818B84|nr:DUF5052 family protein [Dehalobacter sp. DCM]